MQKMNPETIWNATKKIFGKKKYDIIIPKKEKIYVSTLGGSENKYLTTKEEEACKSLRKYECTFTQYKEINQYGILLGMIIGHFYYCILAEDSVIPPDWALKEIRRWLKNRGWEETCPVASEPELESLLLSFRETYPEMRVYHSDTGEEWDLDYKAMEAMGIVF